MSVFDSTDYPTTEPTKLIIGDRWMWKRDDLYGDYPPASFSLKYALRLESTGTEIEITATESGNDYLIEIASATTATYAAGTYSWQAYITRTVDSERHTLASGTVEVIANRDAATTDPRTHAKKVLDAVEAAIEALSLGVKSYSISAGTVARSVTKRDIPELLEMRDKYKVEVQREIAAEQVARGLGNPRRIGVRFNRV